MNFARSMPNCCVKRCERWSHAASGSALDDDGRGLGWRGEEDPTASPSEHALI